MIDEMLYTYRVADIHVIDGDTIAAEIDLGHNTSTRGRYRLYGINCPERNTTEGIDAEVFAQEWVRKELPRGIFIRTVKFKTKDGEKKGKYGRYLAHLQNKDGETLNLALVENGHAVLKEY